VGGQARFGPDLEWLPEGADPAALDYRVNPRRAAAFAVAVRRYGPGPPEGALRPAYSGVRPKIHGPEEPAPDFRIDGPAVDGVHGLVNLLGIESPGLTASLAIAEHVAGLLDG
jgi:L-2-hydroxyglutarate oxidase LhgO